MKFRVAPAAVCRTILANLQAYEPLSATDEALVIDALKNTGIPDVTDRLLAGLSRGAILKVLDALRQDAQEAAPENIRGAGGGA